MNIKKYIAELTVLAEKYPDAELVKSTTYTEAHEYVCNLQKCGNINEDDEFTDEDTYDVNAICLR